MIGRTVSNYRILSRIGEGAVGTVYKAEHLRLQSTVALKFLRPEYLGDATSRARFVREARTAANLDHSCICPVYDYAEIEGQTYLVMPFIDGTSLRDRIANEPLPLLTAVDLAVQMADGLSEAHSQGVVHRDLKPSNVMLTTGEDGRVRVKILDFGLARALDSTRLTATGTTMGTAAYMSPEQARGDRVDGRSDLWSLGVVLYEMVTGRTPFSGRHAAALQYEIVHEKPPRVGRLRPDTPPELRRIIARALAKNRNDRYQSAADMLTDLRGIRGDLTEPVSRLRDWLWRYRNRALMLVAGLVTLTVLAILYAQFFAPQRGDVPSPLLGQPRQVTSDLACEADPAVSPDGSRIAFACNSGGNFDIYVISARGGPPVRLTKDPAADRHPNWFPDGGSVVFDSDRLGDGPGIWRVGQLGGDPHLLITNGEHPAVSPDGRRLAFSRSDTSGLRRIWIAELANSEQTRQITRAADGVWDHRSPAWSPDNRWICYAGAHNLWLVSVDTDEVRQLTQQGVWDSDPVWTSDGKHVLFASLREGTRALWRVRARGGPVQRLTQGTGPESYPSLSRDGARLTYSTQSEDSDVVVTNRRTGTRHAISGLHRDSQPSVSADGKSLAFISNRWNTKFDIWLHDLVEGVPNGPARRLTDQLCSASHPVFSPDGFWLAYYCIEEENRDIWIVPINGAATIRFTDHAAGDYQPAWAPDGRHLAFVSERSGGEAIWVAPVSDGRRTAAPVRVTPPGLVSVQPRWSPDGSQIAFLGYQGDRTDLYLIPADGSEPPRKLAVDVVVQDIQWKTTAAGLWAAAVWEDGQPGLRIVSTDGGASQTPDPPVVLDGAPSYLRFDISADTRIVVWTLERLTGNVWMLDIDVGDSH